MLKRLGIYNPGKLQHKLQMFRTSQNQTISVAKEEV